jgi:hypothetical protein
LYLESVGFSIGQKRKTTKLSTKKIYPARASPRIRHKPKTAKTLDDMKSTTSSTDQKLFNEIFPINENEV